MKFCGLPVDVEYEKNKEWVTERMVITPLLEMDWMKIFKLTIGKIQLAENNQLEREKVFNRFPDVIENKETIDDTEINIQLKPGQYPIKQKARPVPLLFSILETLNIAHFGPVMTESTCTLRKKKPPRPFDLLKKANFNWVVTQLKPTLSLSITRRVSKTSCWAEIFYGSIRFWLI